MLSVGYSACHWCHVMAHESFEDTFTATLLNENVVAIKVDREERPDVDAVYMTVTQAMTGQGGWPMTVFMTPTREPFYAGTYFPRDQFRRLVLVVAKAWRVDPGALGGTRAAPSARLAGQRALWRAAAGSLDLSAVSHRAVPTRARDYDRVRGGFGAAPNFPPSMVCEFLLRRSERPATGESGPDAGPDS